MYALLASVLTGVAMAGVALPVVGGLGLTAKAGADEFLVLPAELKTTPLAQRSRILAADGSLLAVLYRENRVVAPLAEIPELTRKAVMAVEDARFYAHNGIDYKGTLRAAVENSQAGEVTQGGSTLTQQYVKNALLQAANTKAGQEAATAATLDRKLKEARYALALERELSKDEILERYLNIAYFGNGVYGIGTAASYYYSKPAAELTLDQSALLAGIVQSPGRFDPVKAMSDPEQMERLVQRRNLVLRRMLNENFVTQAEHDAAVAAVPAFAIQPVQSGCENPEVTAPFFCDHVRNVLERTDLGRALGSTLEERQDRLLAGGLTIKTTLDPAVQGSAQEAADEQVPRDDPFQAAVAINSVEPTTGAIKAMAVNRTYSEQDLPGHSKLNLATGGSSGFQAGSTFKPFVLAPALQQGIPLDLCIYSPNKYVLRRLPRLRPGRPDRAVPEQRRRQRHRRRAPSTCAPARGTPSTPSTCSSRSAPASRSRPRSRRRWACGSSRRRAERPAAAWRVFTLGVNEVSPLAMAGAYATFPAHGRSARRRPSPRSSTSRGNPVELSQEPAGRSWSRPRRHGDGRADAAWSSAARPSPRRSAGRPPARPAGPTGRAPPGSPASPPSSRPPCGWASRSRSR